VSRYQKGKANLDFSEARDSEWQWHQLGNMQVFTSLQTDNHTSTPPLSFLQAGCPSCRPTNSVKALKAQIYTICSIYMDWQRNKKRKKQPAGYVNWTHLVVEQPAAAAAAVTSSLSSSSSMTSSSAFFVSRFRSTRMHRRRATTTTNSVSYFEADSDERFRSFIIPRHGMAAGMQVARLRAGY